MYRITTCGSAAKKGMIYMTPKKRKTTVIIGMALGITMLSGAAFASYTTANGYEVCKSALKGLTENENYTSALAIKACYDGEELAHQYVTELYDRDGDVKLNRTESYEGEELKTYYQDNSYIHVDSHNGEDVSSYVYTNRDFFTSGAFDLWNGMNEDEKNTTNKIMRFVELVGDTIVGDLKNNFVYVSSENGFDTYEINLDAIQIPEVINAGLSAMFGTFNTGYSSHRADPIAELGEDPVVKNASLKCTVDGEGRLADGKITIVVTGNGHEASMDMSLTMSDYGTTAPQRVDISSLKNVDIMDNMSDEAVTYTVGENDIEIKYED